MWVWGKNIGSVVFCTWNSFFSSPYALEKFLLLFQESSQGSLPPRSFPSHTQADQISLLMKNYILEMFVSYSGLQDSW